ncbi:hypothetical protein KCU85_g8815, partial [Aureobasidium melanogenum]
MVQIQFRVPLPTTREQFENTTLSKLKTIEDSFVLSAFDKDTGIADVECGATDDNTYDRIGSLLQDWVAEEQPRILTYQMVRGTA